eukprot:gene4038-8036_t
MKVNWPIHRRSAIVLIVMSIPQHNYWTNPHCKVLKDYYLKKESSSKPMEARTTQLIKGPSHKVKASKAKNSSSSSPARKSPSIISNEEE